VGPIVWRKMHGLIGIVCNKEEIPLDWKMRIVCSIYKTR